MPQLSAGTRVRGCGKWLLRRRSPRLRSVALFLVVTLVPGSFVVLPLLWWLIQHFRNSQRTAVHRLIAESAASD